MSEVFNYENVFVVISENCTECFTVAFTFLQCSGAPCDFAGFWIPYFVQGNYLVGGF